MAKTEVVVPKYTVPLSAEWFEWRIGGARQGAMNTSVDARPFIHTVRDLKKHQAWLKYFEDEPKTWERLCREVLNTEPDFADKVQLGVEALEAAGHFGAISDKQALDAAARVQAAAEKAEPPAKTGRPKKGVNITPLAKEGNARIVARIAARRPDIHERMKAGEYTSVRRAAIDAGIVREPTTVEKMQKLWLKMTAEEKEAFQMWATEQLC